MTEKPLQARLPAAERRQAILDAAMRVFATGSYAGATTADIAREAGVSEPILYRHFGSKRELYFACLEEAWARLLAAFEAKFTELGPSPVPPFAAIPHAVRVAAPTLWMQAVTEAGEDPEIRKFVRRHMREVHGYLAAFIRAGQEAGKVQPDRDADAEAWIFLGGSLLIAMSDRLGGLVPRDDFATIGESRRRWLTTGS
jgi:AcrR family transcriptional regulator